MQLEILWLQTATSLGNMLSFPLSLRISSHTFPLQWIKETGRAEFSSFKVGVVRPSICVLRKAAQQRERRWPQLSPVLGPLSPTAQSRPLHQLQGFSPHLTSRSPGPWAAFGQKGAESSRCHSSWTTPQTRAGSPRWDCSEASGRATGLKADL